MKPRRHLAAGIVLCCGATACAGTPPSTSSADVDRRSPEAILADAAAALRSVHSYHLAGSARTAAGPIRLDLRIASPTTLGGTLQTSGTSLQIVIISGTTYARGRDFFARQGGTSLGELIGDRWVKMPGSPLSGVTPLTDTGVAADCLLADRGTLSRGQVVSVAGHPAVEVKDAGDRPGTSPSVLSVALDSPHYPLRLRETGPVRPGARPGGRRCGGGSAASDEQTQADFTLDGFGTVASITPPAEALDLGALGAG